MNRSKLSSLKCDIIVQKLSSFKSETGMLFVLEHVFSLKGKLVVKESHSPCCFQNIIKRMFFSKDGQNLEDQ